MEMRLIPTLEKLMFRLNSPTYLYVGTAVA